ncbi:ModD protein [Brockia lithotrophica]|uniref:Putative pyrophosphorylase ModD n=1 Tax=Brockia lithotrophica TaxID=933949 RepID=A0A660L7V3_9BACL|nr:ModD protein [Brockia lithotrophica]RKQ88912.1 molybdenum transport protein [Brockia lithotrophica]
MYTLTTQELEELLREDVPYADLTSELLEIRGKPGRMRYRAREEGVLAGAEVVASLARILGLDPRFVLPAGREILPGKTVLEVEGDAYELHRLWRVGLGVLGFSSGVATGTRKLVLAARKGAPDVPVLATRKALPGTRKLAALAVRAGGGWPHRLGLSESVLVFPQHLPFADDPQPEALVRKLRAIGRDKRILVEVSDVEEAIRYLEAGADGVQFEKVEPEALRHDLPRLKESYPCAVFLAAGGITPETAAAYASTGVDGLVTSWMFTRPPLDFSVEMERA